MSFLSESAETLLLTGNSGDDLPPGEQETADNLPAVLFSRLRSDGTTAFPAEVHNVLDADPRGRTDDHPNGPDVGDRVWFVTKDARKRMIEYAADVLEMSILRPGAIMLLVHSMSGSFKARDVFYCGDNRDPKLSDCHWCWPGERPAVVEGAAVEECHTFSKS